MTLEIVNPTAEPTNATIIAPARPGSLNGERLGVVINGKEYSELVLRRIAAALEQEYSLSGITFWDKKYPATPAPFLEDVADKTTFVLNGVGH